MQDTVREYRTENVIPEFDDSGVQPVPIDINVYCDYFIPVPESQKGAEYYAVSSVLPSDVTLGGTRHLSYAGWELTEEEIERRNIQYVGDSLVLLEDS